MKNGKPHKIPLSLFQNPKKMEAVKTRYDKRRYQALLNNVEGLKPVLEKKKKFLEDYSEIYKFQKRNVSKTLKLYDQLLSAIETFEKVNFNNSVFYEKETK